MADSLRYWRGKTTMVKAPFTDAGHAPVPGTVCRYSVSGGSPDRIRVYGEVGEVALDVPVGPGGPLHPESAEAARSRRWFFSGSEFGPQLVGLAWQRQGGVS